MMAVVLTREVFNSLAKLPANTGRLSRPGWRKPPGSVWKDIVRSQMKTVGLQRCSFVGWLPTGSLARKRSRSGSRCIRIFGCRGHISPKPTSGPGGAKAGVSEGASRSMSAIAMLRQSLTSQPIRSCARPSQCVSSKTVPVWYE